ncbi:MAG TPA: hypothetical protein VGV85_17490, partial [Longimicrobiaceae bacterium]|nr:hypothetical protein [Longimicrobiaceae bacterium]
MRLREVFRFEVAYRLRNPSTWIYGFLLLGIPFLMLHAVDGASSFLNSPENVASMSLMFGMLGMLVTAALFGDAATRDVQSGMHPLFYTAPLREAEYLGGRFLGALAVNAVLLAGVPIGLLAASLMPYQDPRMFGPFQAGAYVQPYLLFLLPGLVLTAAILFAVAALSRQTLPAYLCGIGLFVGYLFAVELRDGVVDAGGAMLADPFAMTVLEELTRYWTPVERNARQIGFPEILLWNRLIWVAVGLAVLALLHLRFRFAHPGGAGPERKARRQAADPGPARVGPLAVPPADRAFGPGARTAQTLAVAWRSLADIARSRAFLAILAGMLAWVFGFGWDVGAQVFGTSTWPVTHLVAGTVLSGTLSTVFAVLMALFAGELVWKERDVGVSDIADAAPVPDWVMLLGRFLALVGMLAALQAVLMAAGVLLQALQGYHRFEIGLYLRILFGLKLADYVLFAALATAVHVVVNHKYLGHLAVVLCFLFTVQAGRFGIRHHLLVFGSDPGWIYSDMNGFGPFVAPLVWFRLYWAAWALLLAVLAGLFHVRGRD